MSKVNSLFMDAPYVHFFVSYQEFHFACWDNMNLFKQVIQFVCWMECMLTHACLYVHIEINYIFSYHHTPFIFSYSLWNGKVIKTKNYERYGNFCVQKMKKESLSLSTEANANNSLPKKNYSALT